MNRLGEKKSVHCIYRFELLKLTFSSYRHFCFIMPQQGMVLTRGLIFFVSLSGASRQTLSSLIIEPSFVIMNI